MKDKKGAIKILISLGVVILGGFLSAIANMILDRVGYPLYDLYQQNSNVVHNNEVVLVYVDQASVDQMSKVDGINFPWPREYWGALTAVAKATKAKAVFFDILFTEESHYGKEDDQSFADLIKETALPVFLPAPDKTKTVKRPVPIIEKATTQLAGVHIPSSSDGVYRVIPEFLPGENDRKIRSMPFAISHYLNETKNSKNLIQYYKNPIEIVSFYNLIRAFRKMSDEGEDAIPESIKKLSNKVWMVGYSAPGLLDLKPTPIDTKTPGVFVHATALLNRLLGDGLDTATGRLIFLVGSIVAMLLVLLERRFKKPFATISFYTSSCIILPLVFSIVFWKLNIWFNPLPLILSLLFLATVYFIYRFQKEWLEMIRLANGLEHSMSKEMLELIKKGDITGLRFVEKKEVTILFSDIVNFTNISEMLTPDDLVQLLNEYYEVIVNLIFEYDGYVDKFIGDAVMAVWGTPMDQANHFELGVNVAIKYKKAVEKLNEKMQVVNPALPKVEARVGLHSGEVVVGHIGSSKRFNYTVIGDAVNLASRLEGIGKQYGTKLIMSGDTVNSIKNNLNLQLLLIDRVQVKGKQQPTEIYTSLENVDLSIITNYNEAFSHYSNERFEQAINYFKNCGDFGPSLVMIDRCQKIIEEGTPKHFNKGIWAHDSK